MAAGCSDSGGTTTTTAPTTSPPETIVTTTTTLTTTTTTTTAATATTTTIDPLARPDKLVSNFDRNSADDFDTTGDDLWRAMLEIADLFNYLESNPVGTGEEMLGLMYLPSHGSWEGLLGGFEELVENDWTYVDPGTQTVAVDVDEVEGDTAIVRWASKRGDQHIADSAGTVVKTYRGWDLDILTYELLRGEDGRWRIAETLGRLNPVPDEALAEMVPVEWTGRDQ